MKTLFTLKSAINQSSLLTIMALISLSPATYPEIVLAAELQTKGTNQSLVFEINNPLIVTIRNYITFSNQGDLETDQLGNFDPLTLKLRTYLKKHNSPLYLYADQMHQYPQWQRALAISWVESNFCRHHVNNNCSGIGVAPGHPLWRKYSNHLAWFEDMTNLLEKPLYKEKLVTFEKMKGVYVKPGSRAWVVGAKTKYAELMALTAEAENEKLAINQNLNNSLVTFPELAMLTK